MRRLVCPQCGAKPINFRWVVLVGFGMLVLLRAMVEARATNFWRGDPESDGGGACGVIGLLVMGVLLMWSLAPNREPRRCPKCGAAIP